MKKFTLKKLTTYVLGMLMVGALGSCMKDDDNTTYPQAVLTMVNGYVSTSGIMYAADNNRIHTPQNPLTYKSYDFAYLFPGSRRIQVATTPSQVTLTDDIYTFNDSTYYTSFVFGKNDEAEHLIIEDELLTDLNDDVALRFFHLSPSESKVNVYLNEESNPLAEGVSYEGAAETDDSSTGTFVVEASGTHEIIVTDETGETLVTREFKFEEGIHYTIILIGDSSSETTPLYIGVVNQYR